MTIHLIMLQDRFGEKWIDSAWVDSENANRRYEDLKYIHSGMGVNNIGLWITKVELQDGIVGKIKKGCRTPQPPPPRLPAET